MQTASAALKMSQVSLLIYSPSWEVDQRGVGVGVASPKACSSYPTLVRLLCKQINLPNDNFDDLPVQSPESYLALFSLRECKSQFSGGHVLCPRLPLSPSLHLAYSWRVVGAH